MASVLRTDFFFNVVLDDPPRCARRAAGIALEGASATKSNQVWTHLFHSSSCSLYHTNFSRRLAMFPECGRRKRLHHSTNIGFLTPGPSLVKPIREQSAIQQKESERDTHMRINRFCLFPSTIGPGNGMVKPCVVPYSEARREPVKGVESTSIAFPSASPSMSIVPKPNPRLL